jgi:hypothetical protein
MLQHGRVQLVREFLTESVSRDPPKWRTVLCTSVRSCLAHLALETTRRDADGCELLAHVVVQIPRYA